MADPAFQLPYNQKGEVLPGELDAQFLEILDQALARQESRQIQRIGESQEGRGFLQSGQTLKRVADEVIGPGLERRQMALLPLAKESALLGRDERLGTQQFERGRQLAGEDFQRTRQFASEQHVRDLDKLERQANIQRSLLELQDMLEGGGLGGFVGGLAGTALGSFGGTAGGILGGRLGASLFGGKDDLKSTGGGMGRLDIRNSNRFLGW